MTLYCRYLVIAASYAPSQRALNQFLEKKLSKTNIPESSSHEPFSKHHIIAWVLIETTTALQLFIKFYIKKITPIAPLVNLI